MMIKMTTKRLLKSTPVLMALALLTVHGCSSGQHGEGGEEQVQGEMATEEAAADTDSIPHEETAAAPAADSGETVAQASPDVSPTAAADPAAAPAATTAATTPTEAAPASTVAAAEAPKATAESEKVVTPATTKKLNKPQRRRASVDKIKAEEKFSEEKSVGMTTGFHQEVSSAPPVQMMPKAAAPVQAPARVTSPPTTTSMNQTQPAPVQTMALQTIQQTMQQTQQQPPQTQPQRVAAAPQQVAPPKPRQPAAVTPIEEEEEPLWKNKAIMASAALLFAGLGFLGFQRLGKKRA